MVPLPNVGVMTIRHVRGHDATEFKGGLESRRAHHDSTLRWVWSSSLAPGKHSLTITLTGAKNARSTGSRVDLDALLVLGRGLAWA